MVIAEALPQHGHIKTRPLFTKPKHHTARATRAVPLRLHDLEFGLYQVFVVSKGNTV